MTESAFVIEHPSYVRIPDEVDEARLKFFLTYTDKSVGFQIRRLKQARWFDAEHHAQRLEDLQAKHHPCLLMQDEKGRYTLSGLAFELMAAFKLPVQDRVYRPEPKIIPWAEVPPPLWEHQKDSFAALLNQRHGAIELATGSGKSYIILHLVKHLGLKTVVMAPTTSIANQLYADFIKHLGKKYVGRYYGGKKEHGKLVTVAIHASLVRIVPGEPAFDAFSSAQVFVADESHLTPAETLKKVCLDLCGNAPYRFFTSGTQMRADGADILLKGITGPVVKKMSVEQGVEKGVLAPLRFVMIQTISDQTYQSDDALRMTQRHFLYNQAIINKAAAIANAAVSRLNHQVLIMIDEVEQFRYLYPLLRHQVGFAHGPLTPENEKGVPEAFKKSDNGALVDAFNKLQLPILIGTSAVGMGTDIRSVQTLINLTGGKSEVQVKQLVGRATRKSRGKEDCTIFDFDVTNVDMMHRHAEVRLAIYEDIFPGHVEIL